jgi:hypothetical protein
VHSSISGRVCKDGGDNDPQKLWKNILDFGASKKEANVFKAWYCLMHLPLQSNDVSGVSLGLLRDSRTQGWGSKKFISREIRGQGRGGRIERKLIYVSF